MSKRIDLSRKFVPINISVITISDTRTIGTDTSGDILTERIIQSGHNLTSRSIVKDEINAITEALEPLISNNLTDVIITTGGTGVTGRDITPEAFEMICDKIIPGFGELFRAISFKKIGTSSLQSRAIAGIAKGKYLFAVPGSPNACKDAWDEILIFQLDIRHKPCNFVELISRLKE